MLALEQRSTTTPLGFSCEASPEKVYGCRLCGDQFKREDHLRRHELSHQKPKFTCATCGKSFHRNDVLKRHQLVHRPGLQNKKRKLRAPTSKVANEELTGGVGSSLQLSTSSLVTVKRSVVTDTTQYNVSNVVDYFSSSSLGSSPGWSPTDVFDSFSSPLSPVSASVNACVEMSREHTLVRIPFLHNTTINYSTAPTELLLGLAALGARDLRTNTECGLSFFLQAERTLRLSQSANKLSKLQVLVLLIDFAAASGNLNYRNWAIKEQHIAVQIAKELLAEPPPRSESIWRNWLHVEELKRTVYALYVLSATLSALYGITSPLTCNSLELSFPCEDELWNARNEAEWSQALLSWNPASRDAFSFPKAVHTILSGDETQIAQYADVGNFGHLILLCGVLEAIDISRKAVFNYRDAKDFVTKSMASFGPRQAFSAALKAWKQLWAPNLLESWMTYGWAHPHLETYSLMEYMISELVDWTQDVQAEEILAIVTEAMSTLIYFAQIGVDQVIANSPRTLTIVCYSLAKRFGQVMHEWIIKMEDVWIAGRAQPASATILKTMQQATRCCLMRCTAARPLQDAQQLRFTDASVDPESLTLLKDQFMAVWTYVLGSDRWMKDSKLFA